MTPEECGQVIDMLVGIYPNLKTNDFTIQGWMMLLGDVPKDAVVASMPRLLSEHQEFAPTPSAIRAAVVETHTGLDIAEEAWAMVEKAIGSRGQWYGPDPDWPELVTRAVNALGWESICQTKIEDMGYARKDFMQFYNAFRKHELAEAHTAIGTGMKEIGQ